MKKNKIIIGSIVLLLIGTMIVLNLAKKPDSVSAFGGGKTYSVEVKEIKKQEISSSISVNGRVEETNKAEVYFESPVNTKKILVSKGQKITKGTRLVELDMSSLETELEQLNITKRVQELGIEKTRAMDSKNSISSLEVSVSVAESNLKSAKTTYDESVADFNKSNELYKSGAISKSELDSAKKMVSDAKIQVENSEYNLKSAKGNLSEAIESNEQSVKTIDIEIETQNQNLKATKSRISEIEGKIKKLNDSSLSPIEGAVAEINIVESSTINIAQPAFKIVNTDKLKIKAAIREFDIKNVKVGQEVKISGDAIDKESEIVGRVEYISPLARTVISSGKEETVIDVDIIIERGTKLLKPGYSVTCDVITYTKKDALVASFEMFGREDKDGNKSVFIVDDEGIIHEKKVKLGISSDFDVEVLEGLNESDLVVINPSLTIRDGVKAKILDDKVK